MRHRYRHISSAHSTSEWLYASYFSTLDTFFVDFQCRITFTHRWHGKTEVWDSGICLWGSQKRIEVFTRVAGYVTSRIWSESSAWFSSHRLRRPTLSVEAESAIRTWSCVCGLLPLLPFLLFIILFSRAFLDQVEDGKIEITANDLPSFLYDNGTVYNPDDEMGGLFRGFLLVRVSMCSV